MKVLNEANCDDNSGASAVAITADFGWSAAAAGRDHTHTAGNFLSHMLSTGEASASDAGRLYTTRPSDRRWRAANLAAKRSIDVLGAGIGLLLLAPILLLIMAAIKLTSRGPVFFRQERVGLGGESFRIFKFRSMYTDRCDTTGVAQTVDGDPRVTPLGRFLRKTSLDELPQLLNVLTGDMSLVGPRPHVAGMLAAGVLYEDLVPGYERRNAMRPGITGLAQVRGLRGPTVDRQHAIDRVRSDIDYIENFNVAMDVKILVVTILREIRGGGGF